MVDSWKMVSKIIRIGQLFNTYKKEAISRYSRNGLLSELGGSLNTFLTQCISIIDFNEKVSCISLKVHKCNNCQKIYLYSIMHFAFP